MGNLLCRHRQIRVMFLGLDSVGKTSLLYHLKLGEVISNMPSSGNNCEIVDIDGIEVALWDLITRGHARELWRHFFTGTDAFVFDLDSCDKQYFHEAMHEFDRVCYQGEVQPPEQSGSMIRDTRLYTVYCGSA